MNSPANSLRLDYQKQGESPLIAVVEFLGSKPMPYSLEQEFCSADDLINWVPLPDNSSPNAKKETECELAQQLHILSQGFRSIRSCKVGNLFIYGAVGVPLQYECDAQTIFFRLLWLTIRHAVSDYIGFTPNQVSDLIAALVPSSKDLLTTPDYRPETNGRTPVGKTFERRLKSLLSIIQNICEKIDAGTPEQADGCRNGWIILANLLAIAEIRLAEMKLNLYPSS